MIAESLRLQMQIHVYTSLLGRKRSLRAVLRSLREAKVPSVGSTVLFQGKTCRWCVCWSFDARLQEHFDLHPERYKVFGRKKIAAQRHEVEWRARVDEEEVWRRVEVFCDACEGVSMEWNGEQLECDVSGFVYHFPGTVGEKKGERGGEHVRFSVTVEEEEENESLVCCHILVVAPWFQHVEWGSQVVLYGSGTAKGGRGESQPSVETVCRETKPLTELFVSLSAFVDPDSPIWNMDQNGDILRHRIEETMDYMSFSCKTDTQCTGSVCLVFLYKL